jgi:hypothetical protein
MSLAVVAGVFGLFSLGSHDDQSMLFGDSPPHYGTAFVCFGAAVALILGGLALSAVIAGNARPLRSTVLAVGVLGFSTVLAALTRSAYPLAVGAIGSLTVAITVGRGQVKRAAAQESALDDAQLPSPPGEAVAVGHGRTSSLVPAVIAGAVGIIAGMVIGRHAYGDVHPPPNFAPFAPAPTPDYLAATPLAVISVLFVAGGLFAAASISRNARPLGVTLIGVGVLAAGTIAGLFLGSNLLSLTAMVTAVAVAVRPGTNGHSHNASS